MGPPGAGARQRRGHGLGSAALSGGGSAAVRGGWAAGAGALRAPSSTCMRRHSLPSGQAAHPSAACSQTSGPAWAGATPLEATPGQCPPPAGQWRGAARGGAGRGVACPVCAAVRRAWAPAGAAALGPAGLALPGPSPWLCSIPHPQLGVKLLNGPQLLLPLGDGAPHSRRAGWRCRRSLPRRPDDGQHARAAWRLLHPLRLRLRGLLLPLLPLLLGGGGQQALALRPGLLPAGEQLVQGDGAVHPLCRAAGEVAVPAKCCGRRVG